MSVATGAVQHIVLPVHDIGRAADFYSTLLGFQAVTDLGSASLLTNGYVILSLVPLAGEEPPARPVRFGFSLAGRAELEAAVRLLDDHRVSYRAIHYVPEMQVDLLSLLDPDGNRVDLIAPAGPG